MAFFLPIGGIIYHLYHLLREPVGNSIEVKETLGETVAVSRVSGQKRCCWSGVVCSCSGWSSGLGDFLEVSDILTPSILMLITIRNQQNKAFRQCGYKYIYIIYIYIYPKCVHGATPIQAFCKKKVVIFSNKPWDSRASCFGFLKREVATLAECVQWPTGTKSYFAPQSCCLICLHQNDEPRILLRWSPPREFYIQIFMSSLFVLQFFMDSVTTKVDPRRLAKTPVDETIIFCVFFVFGFFFTSQRWCWTLGGKPGWRPYGREKSLRFLYIPWVFLYTGWGM